MLCLTETNWLSKTHAEKALLNSTLSCFFYFRIKICSLTNLRVVFSNIKTVLKIGSQKYLHKALELATKTFWILVLTPFPYLCKITRPYLVPFPNYCTWTKSTHQKIQCYLSHVIKVCRWRHEKNFDVITFILKCIYFKKA